MAKRKPFGGMMIKPDANLAKVIGSGSVAPSAMTKKLWGYIKRNKLLKR
jgi:chromatin remodeling complex protein RSC6